MSYTIRETCRACGSKDLTFLFSLGDQYVSDFVDKKGIRAGQYCPIELELCNDCTLVQAKNSPPQDFLYTRHYWYKSGINPVMVDALQDITKAIEDRVELKGGDVVLDIGSNDGTLLRTYNDKLIKVGVEPATNLAEDGSKGVDVFINDFWGAESYWENNPFITDWQPKVITAIGMFYDLEDPNQFIADIAKVLHPEGVFVAQLMCLKNMLNLNDVGNLAHEHLEFYTIESLIQLLGKYELGIFDIETNNVNGESYRIWIQHLSNKKPIVEEEFERCFSAVCSEDGIKEDLDGFAVKAGCNRAALRQFVLQEIRREKTFWVYGASTKGNVILQYYGLTSELITAAADKSPEKWGKYTVGTGIPIKSEEEFRKASPDYAIILPYTFIDEFVQREDYWLQGGGKFIVPLPEFKVL